VLSVCSGSDKSLSSELSGADGVIVAYQFVSGPVSWPASGTNTLVLFSQALKKNMVDIKQESM